MCIKYSSVHVLSKAAAKREKTVNMPKGNLIKVAADFCSSKGKQLVCASAKMKRNSAPWMQQEKEIQKLNSHSQYPPK